MIRSTAEPIFTEYIGKFQITSIEFDRLNVGTLPPVFNGEFTPKSIIFTSPCSDVIISLLWFTTFQVLKCMRLMRRN